MSVESLRLIEAEKLNRFLVLLDMDGVIADIDQPARMIIKRDLGLDIRQVLEEANGKRSYWLPDWPEIQAIPGGPAFCYRLFRRPEVYDLAVPFPGAVETLNEWHNSLILDFGLGIATGRDPDVPEVREASIDWLIHYRLEWLWPNINFGQDKNAVVQRWRANLFADDHASELAGVRPIDEKHRLIKVYFGDRFYSQEGTDPDSKRARNWQELGRIVQLVAMSHNL